MSRVFCSHCGNKTLKKVSVTVSDDGTLRMHFSRNPKVLSPRGLRVSGGSASSRRPEAGRARPLGAGMETNRGQKSSWFLQDSL